MQETWDKFYMTQLGANGRLRWLGATPARFAGAKLVYANQDQIWLDRMHADLRGMESAPTTDDPSASSEG